MKWRSARRSSNVEDRRGQSSTGRGIGKLGLGGVVVVVLVSLVLGQDPMQMLGLVEQAQGPGSTDTTARTPDAGDEQATFVASILGETEDVWSRQFQDQGSDYQVPRLVLFSDRVNSACGGASAAVGPFYCPGDQKIYIDLSFFEQLRDQLGGGGDFAEAYVIAHEVGHHVQTLTGVSAKVNAERVRGGDIEGDGGLLVRQELQADCYSGVWAHHAQQRHAWLEPGDLEEALNTASAIGDDRLQKKSRGTVMPDAFTHGTSAQRVRWFRIGFDSGDAARCDTFAAQAL